MTSLEILKLLTTDVFSWMLLGVVLTWVGIFTQKRIQFFLKKVVINFLFPCLILEKILLNLVLVDIPNIALLFGGALIMFLGSCFISSFWVPHTVKDPPTVNSMMLCNTFHNYGFMVFPICLSLLGEKGLALTLIYSFTGDALLWSLGIYLVQRKPGIRVSGKGIITPPAIAVCLSVFLALAEAPKFIPSQIFSILHYPALLTIPMALIASGGIFFISLSSINKKDLPIKEISLSLISRMIFLPILWLFCISLFLPESMAKSILSIEAIMPASVVIVALVTIYGGNQKFAVLFSLITNMIAIITIPLYLKFIL